MGMLAAVEAWVTRDHKAEWKTWLSYLDNISRARLKINGIKTAVEEPTELSNRSPRLKVSWDPDVLNITGDEVAENFARTKPQIAIGSSNEPGTTSIHILRGRCNLAMTRSWQSGFYNLLSQSATQGLPAWQHRPSCSAVTGM